MSLKARGYLRDLENAFGFLDRAHIGVVDFAWIQFFKLLFLDKATLMSKPLLGEVLPAAIAHAALLHLGVVFLFPKSLNFGSSQTRLL